MKNFAIVCSAALLGMLSLSTYLRAADQCDQVMAADRESSASEMGPLGPTLISLGNRETEAQTDDPVTEEASECEPGRDLRKFLVPVLVIAMALGCTLTLFTKVSFNAHRAKIV